MLANALNENTGIYGYKGDPIFGLYNAQTHKGLNTAPRVESDTLDLKPGEGVFSVVGSGGFSESASGNINYMSKNNSGGTTYTEGTRVVTYNFNTTITGLAEQGTTVKAPSSSVLMSLSATNEEPRSFMVDYILDLDSDTGALWDNEE
jgi:hypothetical protein